MVRGESKKLTVTITEKSTGDPVDVSAATGIIIGAYQEGGKIIQKWSKVSKTGFQDIDVTDAATGVLVVYLGTANLLNAIQNKTLRLECAVEWADSNYQDSKKISMDTNVEIELIEPSIFEGETIST